MTVVADPKLKSTNSSPPKALPSAWRGNLNKSMKQKLVELPLKMQVRDKLIEQKYN